MAICNNKTSIKNYLISITILIGFRSLIQKVVKGRDVSLRHLKCLILGQLSVLTQLRQKGPQSIESLVQVLHPASFAGIGRQPPLPQNHRSHPVFVTYGARIGAGALVTLLGVAVVARPRRRHPLGGLLGAQHVQVAERFARLHYFDASSFRFFGLHTTKDERYMRECGYLLGLIWGPSHPARPLGL